LEAQVLAAHVLLVERTWIVAHPEHEFPELAGENVLQRRLTHEPLAYILGYREFYGRRFAVGPGALIPRQETEALVDAALEIGPPHGRVLDLGTGSGCIGITLKLEQPSWLVTLSDVSTDALAIADDNRQQLSAEVELVHTDGCQGFAAETFELIATNPPYVSRTDELSSDIRDFEPDVALFGTEDGFGFYRRLSIEAATLLTNNGAMVMELGAGQMLKTREIFEGAGWTFAKSCKDLLGVDRVLAFHPPTK
jgi:release factor glutamine methyltransferase